MLVPYHLVYKSLPRRIIKRRRKSHEKRKAIDHPYLYRSRINERAQCKGKAGKDTLRYVENFPFFIPIDYRARKKAAYQDRKILRSEDSSKLHAGVRQIKHQPAERDCLHPGAAHRDSLSEEIQTIVPYGERCESFSAEIPYGIHKSILTSSKFAFMMRSLQKSARRKNPAEFSCEYYFLRAFSFTSCKA